MNLRLDRNSIRLRVRYDEALRLAGEKYLHEQMPMIAGVLDVRVSCCVDEVLVADSSHAGCLEFRVPQQRLLGMLEAEGARKTKSSQEMKGVFRSEDREIELRFEIDVKPAGRPTEREK